MFGELVEHVLRDRVGEPLREVGGCVDDASIVEDEVEVGCLVRVVAVGARALPTIGDSAGESLVDEEFERVVDGRETDPGVLVFDDLVELLGGGVGFGVAECFVDSHARTRASDAVLSEDGFDIVGFVMVAVIGGNHNLFYNENDSKPT